MFQPAAELSVLDRMLPYLIIKCYKPNNNNNNNNNLYNNNANVCVCVRLKHFVG